MKEVLVLGAGMVGVSIAYHLRRRGHSVVLVDRREPGQETSFGNAGLIQREAVRPYPFPRQITKLWRVLPNRRTDIRYRSGAMLASAGALFQYWRHSAPARYKRIVPEYASLVMRGTEEHACLFEAAGAADLIRKDGWLEAFRTRRALDEQIALARDAGSRFGVAYEVLDRAALEASEPALDDTLIGAIRWTDSWSTTDPGGLTQAYARAFEAEGGRVLKAEARDLAQSGQQWQLTTDAGTLSAQSLVLATGPWSREWLARLGYRLPMFYMRGYHMHYAAQEGAELHHALMEFENGYLLSPKRAGIRLTTGAELNTLGAPRRRGQLDAAESQARRIFPLGARLDSEPWIGARPCLPDMKPVIGPAPRHVELWFAFGHGHQGFTLGPLTGRLIGEMLDGEPTCVDMRPFRADRF